MWLVRTVLGVWLALMLLVIAARMFAALEPSERVVRGDAPDEVARRSAWRKRALVRELLPE